MVYITDFSVFLASVLLISLSGVLIPGPLFAVAIKQAKKSKFSGALIAVGHGLVEFPLMFLIFFLLSEIEIPIYAQSAVGLIGGALMVYIGMQTFRSRHKQDTPNASAPSESVIAGVTTTAVNAGFILWWLTIGTTLILNAKIFGLAGFSIFTGVHWSVDFVWYTAAAFLIFKSQRFWTRSVHMGITLFCVAVFVGFGLFFMASALWTLLA